MATTQQRVFVLTQLCAQDPESVETSVHASLKCAVAAACDAAEDEFLGKGVHRRSHLTMEQSDLLHRMAEDLLNKQLWLSSPEAEYRAVIDYVPVEADEKRVLRWGIAAQAESA
jgi:hypothetical protein